MVQQCLGGTAESVGKAEGGMRVGSILKMWVILQGDWFV